MKNKLDSYSCVITVKNVASWRYLPKSQLAWKRFIDEMKYSLFSPYLELNPEHPVIKKVNNLINKIPNLRLLLIK